MTNIVKFNETEIQLINHNNQNCMTCRQIADVLGMVTRNGATDLYNAHKEEFTEEMTCLIKQGRTRVRIFNREGAWLIGMFARTEQAADFRKWVLKVLGNVADKNTGDNSSLIEVSAHTRRLPSGKKEIVLSEKARSEIGGIVKACCGVAIREALSGLIKAYENETPVKTEWPAEADQSLKGVAEAIVDYGRSEYTRGKIEGILKATFDENYQQVGKRMSIRTA